MHLYVKKIEEKDCGPNGITLTHDIVKFFFNPEKSFFEGLEMNKPYPFAHFRNSSEIKDVSVKKHNGFFYIDTAIAALFKENQEEVAIDDLLYIEQVETTYRIKLIKVGDKNYETFNILLNKNDRHLLLLSDERKSGEEEKLETVNKDKPKNNKPLDPPVQIIYYGVPGCGKSNKIKELLQNVSEKNKVRVVFHPEYTNADFIGQILPKVNGHVTYEFTAGPFAQIIKKAYLNPNEKFYLVIEEINRGNAAAIFGDTFQLLDRLKAGETDSLGNDSSNADVNTFTEGWSQYFVQNDDVNEYIRKAVRADDGKYEDSTENVLAEIEINGIHFTANTAIRLPPNLSILATMNTSDQNVFTLDNAFQRRFDMELIRNEFDMTKDAVRVQYDSEIDDTGITWGKFWTWINSKITAMLKGLSSTEDKRIGVWFVSNVNGKIDDKIFAEKVLKYLWDDVFKFKRKDIFADEIDTLEKLIDKFEKAEGAARFDVFKKDAALNG